MKYQSKDEPTVIAEVVKTSKSGTVILKSESNGKTITISAGTLKRAWTPVESDDSATVTETVSESEVTEPAKEKKVKTPKAPKEPKTAKVKIDKPEWATIDGLFSTAKSINGDIQYKTKKSEHDVMFYLGSKIVFAVYVGAQRIRVLFDESEQVRDELKDYEIVKGTSDPSVNLYFANHTQDDVTKVITVIYGDFMNKNKKEEKPEKKQRRSKEKKEEDTVTSEVTEQVTEEVTEQAVAE